MGLKEGGTSPMNHGSKMTDCGGSDLCFGIRENRDKARHDKGHFIGVFCRIRLESQTLGGLRKVFGQIVAHTPVVVTLVNDLVQE